MTMDGYKPQLIVFEELPRNITPEEALLLGRFNQQACIDAQQDAKGNQIYAQEAI